MRTPPHTQSIKKTLTESPLARTPDKYLSYMNDLENSPSLNGSFTVSKLEEIKEEQEESADVIKTDVSSDKDKSDGKQLKTKQEETSPKTSLNALESSLTKIVEDAFIEAKSAESDTTHSKKDTPITEAVIESKISKLASPKNIIEKDYYHEDVLREEELIERIRSNDLSRVKVSITEEDDSAVKSGEVVVSILLYRQFCLLVKLIYVNFLFIEHAGFFQDYNILFVNIQKKTIFSGPSGNKHCSR